jgi:hypothetical protein
MTALTLLIIRHAEKPGEVFPGPGLTLEGAGDDKSLVVRGWQRAGAWSALFGSGTSSGYPRPDAVYAADPNQVPKPGDNISQRPFETVLPLCAKLGLQPVTRHGVGDEQGLVDEITRLTGVVLVCWEHKKIAEAILPKLAQIAPFDFPAKWHGERFDVVLRLDRAAAGAPWSFHQLFPRLLAGDLALPVEVKP